MDACAKVFTLNDTPAERSVHSRYAAAQQAGLDEADSTSIAELYERVAGVRLQLNPVPAEVTP